MNEVAPGANGSGRLVVQDDAVALFDTAKFEHMFRIAKLMAASDLVPVHLKGKEANCMLIIQQALRWKMDPFALAVGTFVVGNKLGYEGKVIAAVVNTRANLKERLKYDDSGEGQNCSVVIRGTFAGEDHERTIKATWVEGEKMSTGGAKWKHPGMESQQLGYYAVRKWARRHCPELILGVLSDDEVEAMSQNVGPDYAKAVGGHSEVPGAGGVPKAVDLATEGVKGTGETAPMTESGVVDEGDPPAAAPPQAKSAAMPETTEAPGTRRPRVKLMFGGKEVYQTGFFRDVKQLLDSVEAHDAFDNLTVEIADAIATAQPTSGQDKLWEHVTPLIQAVKKEFEGIVDTESATPPQHDPTTGEIHDPNPVQRVPADTLSEELELT